MPAYRLPTVRPQGGIPQQNVQAPALAFGPEGRQLEVAGARLEQTSDNLQKIEERESASIDQTRVEGDLNTFVTAKNKAWAQYAQTKGDAAIHAAPKVMADLNELKDKLVGGASNERQKQLLTARLDGHMQHFGGLVQDHGAQQATVWQKATNATTIDKTNNDDTLDPITKAQAIIPAALEKARLEFGAAPDSEVAKRVVADEQSKSFKSSIQQLVDRNQKRDALGLYERVKDKIGLKEDHALHAAMNGIRTSVNGENIANDALRKAGLPGIPSDDSGSGRENNIGNIRPVGASGGFQSFGSFDEGVAATVKNLRAYPKAFNNGQPMTLAQIGAKWAPAGDGANDPAQWAKNVGAAAGIDPKTPIDISSPEIAAKVARGIHAAEWGGGKVRGEADYLPGAKMAFGGPRMPDTGGDQGPAFKGDLKAGYEKAAFDVQNNPTYSREDKASALAILNKTRTEVTSYQTASITSLRDEARTYRADTYLSGNADPAKLQDFANRARSLGQSEMARQYDIFASILPTLKDGLRSAPADQIQTLKSLEEEGSLPKKLLETVRPNDPEALKAANDAFAKLKQGPTDGLPLDPKRVKEVAGMFGALNRPELVREVGAWAQSVGGAQDAVKLPKASQEELKQHLEGLAAKGDLDEKGAMLYHELRAGIAHQDTAFKADAFAAGTKLMGAQPPALDWNSPNVGVALAQRGALADQINASRPGAEAIPLSKPEIASLRDYMAKAGPDGALKTIAALSALPDQHKLGVAAALAGKGTADPQSQMYASAMAKWAENTPEGRESATNIVRGAEIIKNSREGKPISATSPIMLDKLKDKIGSALSQFSGTEVPSEMLEAIRATYAYMADKGGKQYEAAPDDRLLARAIDSVTGGTFDYKGQQVFAPKAGAGYYDLKNALGTLKDTDLPELKSEEGKPITADMIKDGGVLYSVGPGMYLVKLPDRGGELKPVMDPRTGQGYVLGVTGLMDRQATTDQFSAGTAQP